MSKVHSSKISTIKYCVFIIARLVYTAWIKPININYINGFFNL